MIKQLSSHIALSEPLYAIGDVKDELNLHTGELTHRITKLVLNGTENWILESEKPGLYSLSGIMPLTPLKNQICSHFKSADSYSIVYYNDLYFTVAGRPCLIIHYHAKQTVQSFKQYLADEYAAGHPVTVWYTLPTPTTETVTVPEGLSGIIEGYLIQDGTPTPTNPIYPSSRDSVDIWNEIMYRQYGLNETLSPIPTTIFSQGDGIDSCTVYGNTVQNEIPTYDNPIQPQGCGDLESTGEHTGQYKIPILCGNQTTNIYLGETQSTRVIKKLILTGKENWERQPGQTVNYFRIPNMPAIPSKVLCTHYVSPDDNIVYASSVTGIKMQQSATYGVIIACRPPNISSLTLSGFKQFLADEYAAGHPVIVYYVMATPETTILNEPLMKVEDYADSVVYGSNIPTTFGQNDIDVNTQIKPLKLDITYNALRRAKVYKNDRWILNPSIDWSQTLKISDLQSKKIKEMEGEYIGYNIHT